MNLTAIGVIAIAAVIITVIVVLWAFGVVPA